MRSNAGSRLLCLPDTGPNFGSAPAPPIQILEDHFTALTCVPITAACAQATGAIHWTRIAKHYPMKDLGFF